MYLVLGIVSCIFVVMGTRNRDIEEFLIGVIIGTATALSLVVST